MPLNDHHDYHGHHTFESNNVDNHLQAERSSAAIFSQASHRKKKEEEDFDLAFKGNLKAVPLIPNIELIDGLIKEGMNETHQQI